MREDDRKNGLIEPISLNGLKIGSERRKLRDLSQTSQGLTLPSSFIQKLRKLGWAIGVDLEVSLITNPTFLDGYIVIQVAKEN